MGKPIRPLCQTQVPFAPLLEHQDRVRCWLQHFGKLWPAMRVLSANHTQEWSLWLGAVLWWSGQSFMYRSCRGAAGCQSWPCLSFMRAASAIPSPGSGKSSTHPL